MIHLKNIGKTILENMFIFSSKEENKKNKIVPINLFGNFHESLSKLVLDTGHLETYLLLIIYI